MAKKKTKSAKSSTATKARPAPAAKSAKKPHKAPHDHHHDHCHDEDCGEIEVELDNTERKTIEMVLDSEPMRAALESEASAALASTVRKFCRQYGTTLSSAQAHNVAMVLFNG